MGNYLIYKHNIVRENTIGKFFSNNKIFWGDNKTTIKDFLLFNDERLNSNLDRILNEYTEDLKIKYRDLFNSLNKSGKLNNSYFERDEVKNLPLFIGTELFIPKMNFNPELVSVVGKNLFLDQENDFNFLWSKKLFELMTSDGYVRSNSINLGSGLNYSIELINENIQVWIWVRALNKILNLSAFVLTCSTNKQDIGSFNITFNPIKNLEKLNLENNRNIIDFFNLDQFGISNIDFIHQHIQMNDIVFIRYEKLLLEEKNENGYQEYELEIGSDKLPGKIWDMIGLVDLNILRSSGTDVNYEINISGRDLMKLLTDDASYFLPLYYLASDKSVVNFNYNPSDKFFKRNFVGTFGPANNTPSPYEFTVGYRSIDDTIGFIINQLSNLGVTGNVDLFKNYSERRSSAYKITNSDKEYLSTNEVNGIWQIVKIFYDKLLTNRRISDESLVRADGTIMDFFNKVCQRPFVEFYGDTYGDEFNLIIRQPPFTKGAIRSFLEGQEYHPSMDGTESQIIEKTNKSGIYEIIDLDLKDISGYDSLMWDNTYYTSYQIEPVNEIIGQYTNMIMGGMVPIFYIEEFANIFGNRRLSIVNNYITAPVFGKSSEDDNSYRSALINDFKYLIDTNFYLPFTRKGNISLIKGDRRIKKGIFIRINPTREIFYVEGVNNSVSFLNSRVERITSIQVSRGMIENYIFGDVGYDNNGNIIKDINKNDIKFCYFDILKTYIYNKKVNRKIENFSPVSDLNKYRKYNIKIGAKNSPADRNNNPGNLIFANQKSAIKGDIKSISYNQEIGGSKAVYWAKFDTAEDGFEEVIRQIGIYSRKEKTNTIRKAISTYAPSSENNTNEYINFVCKRLNVSPDTKLDQVDHFEMAKAMIIKESSSTVIYIEGVKENDKEIKSQDTEKVIEIIEKNLDWHFDKDQFDFFIGRKQFNLIKNNERQK